MMTKVLIVDDEPSMLDMYKFKFELNQYTVMSAVDGHDGLEKAHSFQPDVILLDIMMPKMSGLEVLEALKSDPQTKKIPVILLTNVSSGDADCEKGLKMGAVSYLVKSSYTPKEIVGKVQEITAGYLHENGTPIPSVTVPVKNE